jgi:hypothetical protein
MDLEPPEPAQLDDKARRARTILVILTAVFIMAPLLMYFLVGKSLVPRR